MIYRLLAVLLLAVLAAACTTRSISNSSYSPSGYYGYDRGNSLYRGEISEFSVLGIDADKEYSDTEIANQLNSAKPEISLRKGDSILLIQSGALIPDDEMLIQLGKYFDVTPFTGVPDEEKQSNANYSAGLRFAAARAGIEKIVVYWGTLESGIENLGTKTVSWVPIVGGVVPDQAQILRIKLKVGVVDVATGHWEMFVPQTFEDTSISSRHNRASLDQQQVLLLKEDAYKAATDAILAKY